MAARLAMTAACVAALVAMPAAAAKRMTGMKDRAPAATAFTGLTLKHDPRRSRYLLNDDLPEHYGTPDEGIRVRWRVNKVKVKVPFALNY